MLSNQTLEDAEERLEHLKRLDNRGLISEPDLQDLLKEQEKMTRRLQRSSLEQKLKEIE